MKQILAHRPDVTREELLKAIETKTAASSGLLTEEAAARLVAAEHGVDVKVGKRIPEIRIAQLVSGLNDVTVSGRVLLVGTPREYAHQGRVGQMVRLLMGDRTGMVNVVLWDDKAELAARIKPRQVWRVTHGYVRRSRDGTVELHVGKRGDAQPSPDADEGLFPQIEGFCSKIATLEAAHKRTIVEGVVQAVSPVSAFSRHDGTEGKVAKAGIEDDTGRIQVVFWNEKAESAAGLREGEAVLLVNARVRRSRRDATLELHVEDSASVEVSSRPKGFLRIGDLEDGVMIPSIAGSVATKPVRREVTTRSGEKVAVASFELEDASGRVWVAVWRRHVEQVEGLAVGARIRLKDAFVRRGFGGQLEVNSRASSVIEVEG